MTIQMYDLAGADPALRFSPYCWRARLALAHKDLPVETIPWRFTDQAALAFAGAEKVPVIRDGDRVVHDSWAIAVYLEERYPERPSLFGGPGGQAHARFVNAWADTVLNPGLIKLVLRDIFDVLAPQDRDYFRRSREQRFGKTLEQVVAGREQAVESVRQSLQPVRAVLDAQQWLGGGAPSYADHIVFGSLLCPRCVSGFAVVAEDDPVVAWRERMLDQYGGLGRRAVTPARAAA